MSAWARPGVKCVCVVAGSIGPAVREVCTVDEVKADNSGVWLVLAEYGWCHSGAASGVERRRPLFRVARFRPLITRTQDQDIALLSHLLTGKPIEVDA